MGNMAQQQLPAPAPPPFDPTQQPGFINAPATGLSIDPATGQPLAQTTGAPGATPGSNPLITQTPGGPTGQLFGGAAAQQGGQQFGITGAQLNPALPGFTGAFSQAAPAVGGAQANAVGPLPGEPNPIGPGPIIPGAPPGGGVQPVNPIPPGTGTSGTGFGQGGIVNTETLAPGTIAQADVRTDLIKRLEDLGFGQLDNILGDDFLGQALGGGQQGQVPGQQSFNFGPGGSALLRNLEQGPLQTNQISGFQGNQLLGAGGAALQGQLGGSPEATALSQLQGSINPLLGGIQGFNAPGAQQSALGGAASSALQQGLGGGGPESQVFNQAQQQLGGGVNPGQGVVDALQPIFQDQLSRQLGDLSNSASSVFNSATAQQGADLQRQSLQDFNLLSAQALQQGQTQQTQNLGLLGQLAGQAGGAGFGRALQAGQLGLGQSQLLTGGGQGAAGLDLQALLGGGQQALGAGQLLGGLAGQAGGAGRQAAGAAQAGGLAQAQAQTGANQAGQQQTIQNALASLGLFQNTQQGLINSAQQQQQFGSQFGLAGQNQAFNQQSGPALALLMQALGIAEPTALQTVVTPRDADQ